MRVHFFLLAGLVAALCGTAADMLLVGFIQAPQRYPEFIRLFGEEADLATLMLPADAQSLLWGVLPATFTAVLYLAASFGVYRLHDVQNAAARWSLALLLAGYALSPLAHAGFYYLGVAAHALRDSPHAAHAVLAAHWRQLHAMLLHWLPAVLLLAAGWLLFAVQTLRGRTRLPSWLRFLTLCRWHWRWPGYAVCFRKCRLRL
ncbi:MAG: hypothetical protein Q4A62_01015 [Eikenella sp.]|nr:hypothetical protein [Eikenella sp.]